MEDSKLTLIFFVLAAAICLFLIVRGTTKLVSKLTEKEPEMTNTESIRANEIHRYSGSLPSWHIVRAKEDPVVIEHDSSNEYFDGVYSCLCASELAHGLRVMCLEYRLNCLASLAKRYFRLAPLQKSTRRVSTLTETASANSYTIDPDGSFLKI